MSPTNSQHSDAGAIKALAIEAAIQRGAAEVRVVSAFADSASRERLRESFARGDLATWNYDDDYARAASDPQTLLPQARSVICIAVPYATRQARSKRLRGRVSNYAWSLDYHQRLRTLLAEVAAIVDAAAGEPVTAIACDTKPIAERAYAARAGLGWVGKHTNLISPALGSFIFLGEVVTTLDLPVDQPLRKSCGSCVRCVDACPTGALRGDYTIDAKKCIADLTQRTDPIPRELRPSLGDWIWGCDLCQLVCPPTRMAGDTGGSSFEPRDLYVQSPDLIALLQLRSGEFKRRFAPTAMGWRGAAVLRRNAAIALGNALDRSAVGALATALREDPHPMVRGAAAWALGRIGSPRALEALETCALTEKESAVREEIALTLS